EMDSPCLDAGISSSDDLNLGVLDLALNQRLLGESLDIGCYEGGGLVLAPQNVNISGNSAICPGEEANLEANAEAQGVLSYQWYLDEMPISDSSEVIVNQEGNYWVEVTNIGGSTASDVFFLEQEPFPEWSPEITPVCSEEDFGEAVIQGEGYDGFTIAMLDFTGTGSLSLNQLQAGEYNVLITSPNGCQVNETINVPQSSNPITSEATFTPASCQNCADGSYNIEFNGGEGNLEMDGPLQLANLAVGTYLVCAQDELGCHQCQEISVNVYYGLADLNQDGQLNSIDLLTFMGEYGCQGESCQADFNGDNVVNLSDLLTFLSFFNL
ncbi:MAG: hypothetical protein AAF193_07360, partial [Bacteroidota bacterium]